MKPRIRSQQNKNIMQISARNLLKGKIKSIEDGAKGYSA